MVGLVEAVTALGDQIPGIFRDAVASLRSWRPDRRIRVSEIAAPGGIAPYSYAVSAVARQGVEPPVNGKLVLLHDPRGQSAWEGTLRLVSFLRVEVDDELHTDPMLTHIAWSWLSTGLQVCAAGHIALGGTVTCTIDTRFGGLRDDHESTRDATDAAVEIRASWTPVTADLAPHLRAWCHQLAASAGLPPDEVIGRA